MTGLFPTFDQWLPDSNSLGIAPGHEEVLPDQGKLTDQPTMEDVATPDTYVHRQNCARLFVDWPHANVLSTIEFTAVVFQVLAHRVYDPALRHFFDAKQFTTKRIDSGGDGQAK